MAVAEAQEPLFTAALLRKRQEQQGDRFVDVSQKPIEMLFTTWLMIQKGVFDSHGRKINKRSTPSREEANTSR